MSAVAPVIILLYPIPHMPDDFTNKLSVKYRRFGLFFILLLSTAVLFSCVKGPTRPVQSDSSALEINITNRQGKTPDLYSIIITMNNGETIPACCENGTCNHSRISAGARGIILREPSDSLGIVIKAKQYHTSRHTYTLPASENSVNVVLSEFDSFKMSDDFANGFTGNDGLALFQAMAVRNTGETGITYTMKFYIDRLDSAPVVYFQNTIRHPLHYDFARDVLKRPLTVDEYEQQTYYGNDRLAMAGSIISYSDFQVKSATSTDTMFSPFTIEFFPADNLTPEQALKAYGLIEERMLFLSNCGNENRLYYLPPTAVHASALANFVHVFSANGALWLERETLYNNIKMQFLNRGEAYGTLKVLTPDSFISTPLSYKDIVILTRLPNEVPLVGGTITEELQTPLAHVNVAARSRGTPNMALLSASSDAHIAALLDSLVHFKVTADTFLLEKTTLDQANRFWAGLVPGIPHIPKSDLLCDTLIPFSDLTFNDNIRVGAKAANLAELSKLLKEHAPDGFAVPFSFYADFLAYGVITSDLCDEAASDCIEEGRSPEICAIAAQYRKPFGEGNATLRGFIDSLLADTKFQTDSRFREASLDGLRYFIHHIQVDSSFGRMLDAYVNKMFQGRRVRLRSSTNAEDLEHFSGAGLYRSVSAGDAGSGLPSSKIRKVWGSVWNWRAFEERAFWNIHHKNVYMGVAVHGAFTDEEANGVLVTKSIADASIDGFYVNVQPGEKSVTNPEKGALPEIVIIMSGAVIRHCYSSLSPETPVMSDNEMKELFEIALRVKNHFTTLYGKDPWDYSFALELEFKLDDPQRQVYVKQVRPFSK